MEALSWEFVKLKFPAKPVLEGLCKADWDDHVEFILGEDVYEHAVKNEFDQVVYRPSWALTLNLELHIRKRACYLANHDKVRTLKEGLKEARAEEKAIVQHFATPIGHPGRRRSSCRSSPGRLLQLAGASCRQVALPRARARRSPPPDHP